MIFEFTARNKFGQVQSGKIEAKTEVSAVEMLQKNGLVIISLEEEGKRNVLSRNISFLSRVSTKELVNFSRQLSILFNAKVPLIEALNSLADQSTNPFFKDIIYKMSNDIESGTPLSRAASKHPRAFDTFYISMLQSGEVSGNLQNTLNYLADYTEKRYYLVSKVRSAMIYPAFILGAFIVATVFILTQIFPSILSILEGSNVELPLPTKIIVGLSNLLIGWWWLLLILVVGIISGISYYIKTTEEGKYRFDLFKLRVPIFQKLFREMYIAHFCENMSTLIKGGLPILRAFEISADVIGNVIFYSIIMEAREKVRRGEMLGKVFEQYPREIPPMVTQMILTGEKSGQLESVLEKIAVFYTREVDRVISNLSQLIEPLLLVILGAGVGLLIAAVLIPIYSVVSGA